MNSLSCPTDQPTVPPISIHGNSTLPVVRAENPSNNFHSLSHHNQASRTFCAFFLQNIPTILQMILGAFVKINQPPLLLLLLTIPYPTVCRPQPINTKLPTHTLMHFSPCCSAHLTTTRNKQTKKNPVIFLLNSFPYRDKFHESKKSGQLPSQPYPWA